MFNKNFVWGVATASYQIEGGAHEADKGLNVWDVGSATKGRIFEGHSGDVGCDHYHLFKEDVRLMKELGIQGYRFSINWARLIPEGTGKISEDGKRFYLELLEELKQAGIQPWVTLFHWDYPYALYQKGGWLNADSPKWFEEYAGVCAELFSPYVSHFILINEPQCFLGLGHSSGEHAPFLKLPDSEVMRAAHNVLLGCGLAEKKIRKICGNSVKIGTAQAYWPALPYTENDVELAREETFTCHKNFGSVNYYTDPLLLGHYPEDVLAWQKECGFAFPESDMEIIKSKFDFYGLNTYTGDRVTRENGKIVYPKPAPTVPRTDTRWTVHPDAMYYGPKFIWDRYHLPIVYTENGVALAEWKDLNGQINDDSRIDFLKRYLRELSRAAEEVEIDGYFYWSLIDNFEWAEGFSKKFGLIHVDYETRERTLKKSAYFFKKIIETNGEEIWK